MRVNVAQFRMLPLDVHGILKDVPLRDVTAVDLPSGGAGRTLSDVRALIPTGELLGASPLARALFALRLWLGRVFAWDRSEHDRPQTSYLSRHPLYGPGVRLKEVPGCARAAAADLEGSVDCRASDSAAAERSNSGVSETI